MDFAVRIKRGVADRFGIWLRPEQIDAWQAADPHTAAYLCVSASAAFYSDARLRLAVEKMVIVENGVDAARLAPLAPEERNRERARLGLAPDHFVFVNVAEVGS